MGEENSSPGQCLHNKANGLLTPPQEQSKGIFSSSESEAQQGRQNNTHTLCLIESTILSKQQKRFLLLHREINLTFPKAVFLTCAVMDSSSNERVHKESFSSRGHQVRRVIEGLSGRWVSVLRQCCIEEKSE